MKEYDEATLKKVQQTELGILKDFIKVCDENNLTWFGDAGSGIGALRHKGYIPWMMILMLSCQEKILTR